MRTILLTIILLVSFATYGQTIQGGQPLIAISEIMYNPPESGTDSLEYIELHNYGTYDVNLVGWQFSSGIIYTFPNVWIPSGGFLVICSDSLAFLNFYGFSARQYTQSLNNNTDNIILRDQLNNIIDEVDYSNTGLWPNGQVLSPAGGGPSIEICDFNLDNNIGSNWALASTAVGGVVNGLQVYGTPGAFCYFYNFIAHIRITEIMYNPGNNDYEFIELYNANSMPVFLAGYTFTSGITFTFPSVNIGAGDFLYLVSNSSIADSFYGYNLIGFTSYQYTDSLSNLGEKLVLVNAAGSIIDSLTYRNSAPWPTEPSEGGKSLSLCNIMEDNSNGNNWGTGLFYVGNNGTDEIYATIGSVTCIGETIGLTETAKENGIILAPNPVEGELVIYNTGNKNYNAQFYDVTGRQVLSGNIAMGATNFNATTLAPGMYIARLTETATNSTLTVKFLKK